MNVSTYMLMHSLVFGMLIVGFGSAITMSTVTPKTTRSQNVKDGVMFSFMFIIAVSLMFIVADFFLTVAGNHG